MDRSWWQTYQIEASNVFTGEFSAPISIESVKQFKITAGNSGAGAIVLAKELGCERVILLGCDCSHNQRKTHWHGDHPKHLGNAGTVNKMPEQFEKVKRYIGGMDVVNCSRVTRLNAFRIGKLEDELKPQ